MRTMGWCGCWRWVALLVASAFSQALLAEKVATTPAPSGYVNDYADVLSASGKADIEARCRQLHRGTRAQVFVVTIHTLDGEPVERFANELFAKWKIGDAKTDRGLLMIFAIDEHKRWVEVGYGLEGPLNDAKVGDIGREMVPALRRSDYDGAVRLGVAEVAKVIYADAGVTPPVSRNSAASSTGHPNDWATMYVVILLLAMLLVVVLLLVLVRRSRDHLADRNVADSGPSFYTQSDPASMQPSSTWSQPIVYEPGPSAVAPHDTLSSSTGGGLWAFGSSSSGSSSDDSFSGGDGGSSGGGGAGGDW